MLVDIPVTERTIQILDVSIRLRQIREFEQRLKQISDQPETANADDFDRFLDAPPRLLQPWLKKHPTVAARYHDYQEDPSQVASTLFRFMRMAWTHAGIPDEPAWNWHHFILCQCMEDVAAGKIPRLLINVPPGLTKTLTIGVFFCAWRWAIDPSESFLYGSYSDEIPIRTANQFRTLILSPWFQKRWGHKFKLTKTNEKDIFNSAGGFRMGRGTQGGGTGAHPLYVLVDDAQKGMSIHSDTDMKKAPRWYAGTLATRGILKESRHVILMQRLAINDLSGLILGECSHDEEGLAFGRDWHHVCLPMRFRKNSPYRYPLDPRTEDGELIWPEKIGPEALQRLIRAMELDGEPNVDAQLDQHPKLDIRNTFEDLTRGRLTIRDIPASIQQGRAVRAWDRAGTQGGGDWTAGVLMVEHEGRFYVLDVFRAQVNPLSRDNLIQRYSEHDARNFPNYRAVNEVMPGPDGRQVHSELAIRLQKAGIQIMAQNPSKDKVTRARPVAAAIKYGVCFYLSDKPWTFQFEQELSQFPNGANDDQVDALAHAFNGLRDWEAGKV